MGMLIQDICNRDVVCAPRETTVVQAAALMREHHVGDVIVIDRPDAERMPIGIVTDRDIVIEVIAKGVDPRTATLGDLVPWGRLVTVEETDTDTETLALMHARGVRRMPVIDAAGVLVGIITLDDILPRLARELGQLAEFGQRGRERETQTRPSHA